MKKITPKALLIALLALTAFGQTKLAAAHSKVGSLGSAATSIDYYQVTCSDLGDGSGSTAKLYVAVKNTSAATTPKVSVQIIRGNVATTRTDAVNGNAAYSPGVYFPGTDGDFYLMIDKAGAGAVNYALEYHCQNAGSDHTGTDIFQIINQ